MSAQGGKRAASLKQTSGPAPGHRAESFSFVRAPHESAGLSAFLEDEALGEVFGFARLGLAGGVSASISAFWEDEAFGFARLDLAGS